MARPLRRRGRGRAARPLLPAAPQPGAFAAEATAGIEALRRQRRSGPAIARELGLPGSTVGLALRRLGLGRLSALDPEPAIIRYEREHPGELIHLDTKKLGRIDGVGHRITGDRRGRSSKRGTGWEYLHVAVDTPRAWPSPLSPNGQGQRPWQQQLVHPSFGQVQCICRTIAVRLVATPGIPAKCLIWFVSPTGFEPVLPT